MIVNSPSVRAVPTAMRPAKVGLADLPGQYLALRDEILPLVDAVAQAGSFILGPQVAAFERDFAAYVGTKHCIGVNSGTSALHLALLCAGVRPGDEVITVPMTFIATAWAISYVGARPVFADVEPQTATMDPAQVRRCITPRTRAIVPVHLYGQMAEMDELMEISRRYGIPIIEDAAQAHGAEYRGRRAGTFGQSGCFSFYPGKNLGAYGEAGAVVTDDDQIADRCRCLRDHAQRERYHHEEVGFNYRMDGLQGAILGVKLKHLEAWTAARRRIAGEYLERLAGLPIRLPAESKLRRHVWHLFVARHPERDQIRCALEREGIQTGLHYPVPLHLQRAYGALGYGSGSFPVAEGIGRECMSLPLFPEMSDAQVEHVINCLTQVTREAGRAA